MMSFHSIILRLVI